MTTDDIRPARIDEARALGGLIGEAFAQDPVSLWSLGSPASIRSTFVTLCRNVYSPRGVCLTAPERGGTMWIGPGVDKSLGGGPMLGLALRLTLTEGRGALKRALALDEAMTARRPKTPHMYLFAVGVLPSARGQGLARALIGQTLAEADRQGLPAYLENTNPRNASLYQGLGFEPVETFHAAPDAPPITAMWRPAASATPAA
jgi:GNAT superfamily N-acetyltransferase